MNTPTGRIKVRTADPSDSSDGRTLNAGQYMATAAVVWLRGRMKFKALKPLWLLATALVTAASGSAGETAPEATPEDI